MAPESACKMHSGQQQQLKALAARLSIPLTDTHILAVQDFLTHRDHEPRTCP